MSRTPISNKELDRGDNDLGMDPDNLLDVAEIEDIVAAEDREAERLERETENADVGERSLDRIVPQV